MSTSKRSFKRPFQPSLSSYFGRTFTDSDSSPQTAQQASSILSPTLLPATIQSSLLNVGMRVRKSVPEGYKTRPKAFFCAPHSSPSSSAQLEPSSSSHRNQSSIEYNTELVPYCGILRVGGGCGHNNNTSPQPVPAEEDLPPLEFDRHESSWDLGFLSSSQDSVSSNSEFMVATPSSSSIAAAAVAEQRTNNKRWREDADEEDLDVEAQPVSPRSRPVSHTPMPNLDFLRRIAVPKTRRRKIALDEGMIRESEMMDVEDFEEADFLDGIEWGER